MAACESSDWLPPGFTEKIKYSKGRKIKYYYNAATGTKHYSKKDVLRATADDGLHVSPQTKDGDEDGLCSNKNAVAMLVETKDSSEWLPEGWVMEEKAQQSGTKKGTLYKVYIEWSSGRKVYSKAAVIRYLNTLDCANTATIQNEDIIGGAGNDNGLLGTPQTTNDDENGLSSDKNIDDSVKENDTPEWLPEGWTMEERPRHVSSRKGETYKVYSEISSGKFFFSRAAVAQYLNISDNADTTTVKNETKANDTPEWLPQGWTMEVRQRHRGSLNGATYKVYIEGSSGKRFYSRASVTQYLNSVGHTNPPRAQNNDTVDNQQFGTPQTASANRNGNDNKNVSSVSVKTDDTSRWLPEGWVVEEKPRQSSSGKGSSYKIYTELSSGSKFYSRPAVARYLSTVNPANNTPVQNDIDIVDKSCPGNSSQCISVTSSGPISEKKKTNNFEVTSEITAADDLPPGWIKEIRTKKSGKKIRRDPFYTDPVSGYVFRSKLDALRYVETNDISRCACRPFKRESDELKGELVGGETFGTKSRVESKILNGTQGNDASNHEEKTTSANTAKRPASSSGVKKQIDRSPVSKKRRGIDLPSRISKQLTEMQSNLEPAHLKMDKSSLDIESEKANNKKPEDETDGKAGEKELEDVKKSPESQLGYDFGDSWSDPVEFALKTLCGEMPIEDNLPFPGSLNEALKIPCNQADGSSKPSQSEESPNMFKTAFVPQTEPSPGKRHGALALLQSNPALFSGPGNVGCNGQLNTEDGKQDLWTNTKP